MKMFSTLAAAALAASLMIPMAMTTPAMAGNVGRILTEGLYGGSAYLACGRKVQCYKSGATFGGKVFDRSQQFTEWYGDKARGAGKWVRRQFTD